jgi:NAD(P)-dependent dehydrogenase (short-subunit alcohol dehydrogenase family)
MGASLILVSMIMRVRHMITSGSGVMRSMIGQEAYAVIMRHVVITGTSRGLGSALLEQLLADPGTRVLALSRDFTAQQWSHERITARRCDLADVATLPATDELREFFAETVDGHTFTQTEVVLIHNAATIQPIGAVGALPADLLLRAATVNFTAPLLLTNAVLAARPAGARLRILFVSSGAAHRVIDGWSVYSATKRGAEEFFSHVSAEHRDDPLVTVANVNPGVIDTGMQATIRAAEFGERQRFVDRHEQGELRPPVEVAEKVITEYLAS